MRAGLLIRLLFLGACVTILYNLKVTTLSSSTNIPTNNNNRVDSHHDVLAATPTDAPTEEVESEEKHDLSVPPRITHRNPFSKLLSRLAELSSVRDNSVGATEEEIQYARGSLIVPIWPKTKRIERAEDAVMAWFQVGQSTMHPFVVLITSSKKDLLWGNRLVELHKNVTVLSFVHGGGESSTSNTFSNHWVIDIQKGFVFEPFFKVCHFFTVQFLPSLFAERITAQDLDKHLPLARISFIMLPRGQVSNLVAAVSSSYTFQWKIVWMDSNAPLDLVRFELLTMKRGCLKTWDAKEVQWGRRTTVGYDSETGTVSFEVISTNKRLARSIHPFSYVPSININTLLFIGLPEMLLYRTLGMMIATPRYSDPMPHNWILGLGGQALRIDKVDKRYDEDVNEGQAFWGRNTAGYLRLLSDNLCLPISSKYGVGQDVVNTCKECAHCADASECSYLPKGKPPCASCRECGRCVASHASQFSSSSASAKPCLFKYRTWHGSIRMWKKWENEWNR